MRRRKLLVVLAAYTLADKHASKEDYIPLSQRLKADADLLEDEIWRLFDTENYAFAPEQDDRYIDNPNYESWAVALKKLSDEGLIDRQRLLDCSLSALQSDFKQNMLIGYARCHETLAPTADEMRTRQGHYTDLLAARANPVVSFAVAMLKHMEKAKLLDDETFVTAADRVFASPTKTSAIAVLGVLEKIGQRSPKLIPQAARAIADQALLHPVNDVKGAALKLLAKWQKHLGGAVANRVADQLSERLAELPATLRSDAEQLVRR
jgi:hypothetical protein